MSTSTTRWMWPRLQTTWLQLYFSNLFSVWLTNNKILLNIIQRPQYPQQLPQFETILCPNISQVYIQMIMHGRGPTRRRATDAAACASVPRPVFFHDSGRIGRNRRFRPKFNQKKKNLRNAPSHSLRFILVSRLSSAPLTLVSLCASSSNPPPLDNW